MIRARAEAERNINSAAAANRPTHFTGTFFRKKVKLWLN